MTEAAIPEPTPEQAALFARVRRLMLIAGLTTAVAVGAVLIAIGYRLFRGSVAVFRRHNSVGSKVHFFGFSHGADFRFRTNQDWFNQAEFRGFDWTEQRIVIARMRDDALDRGQFLAAFEQLRKFVGPSQNHLRGREVRVGQSMIGSAHGHSTGDKLAAIGLHPAIEHHQPLGLFFASRHGRGEFVAGLDASFKVKILRRYRRAWARQLPIEKTRQQRFGAYGLRVHFVLCGLLAIGNLKGINVAADERECFHLSFAQTPFDGCSIANFNFIKGYVG